MQLVSVGIFWLKSITHQNERNKKTQYNYSDSDSKQSTSSRCFSLQHLCVLFFQAISMLLGFKGEMSILWSMCFQF